MLKILKSSLLTAAMLFSIHTAQAATIVGLTTANQIVRFNSATPSITSAPLAVTGILAGQTLTGIDFRPVDGALVGVSLSNSGTAQAYIGPGVASGALAAVVGVLGAIFLALFAVIYYPIKRMLKRRRAVAGDTGSDSAK